MATKKRVVFSFDERSYESLERLKEQARFGSLAATVKESLQVTNALQQQKKPKEIQALTLPHIPLALVQSKVQRLREKRKNDPEEENEFQSTKPNRGTSSLQYFVLYLFNNYFLC